MKKLYTAFFLMLTGFSVFAQNGVIRELSGTVELKLPEAEGYIPAKSGDVLSRNTVISTGFKSSALIEVGSVRIAVRPLTRMTLTELAADAGTETLNVNLRAGRVRVDVKPPAGAKAAVSVSSPVATASVRGTSFEFDTLNLYVNEGTVSFRGSRGIGMLVKEGSSSHIESGGTVSDPIGAQLAGLLPSYPVGTVETGGVVVNESHILPGESLNITIKF